MNNQARIKQSLSTLGSVLISANGEAKSKADLVSFDFGASASHLVQCEALIKCCGWIEELAHESEDKPTIARMIELKKALCSLYDTI